VTALSPVDDRTGLIRWVIDIPVEPGEPRLFNASVKMADVAVYNGRPCYDNNGGSGLSRDAARMAAVGEGLERYCCSVYDPADLLCGRFAYLAARYDVQDPAGFALFHPEQAGHGPDDKVLAWTWAWSLTAARPVLVPACLVYMPYAPCFPSDGESVLAPAVSTGLACAATRDEAVLRGLYEAIERDAFMITWLNRLPVPEVDFATSPSLRALHDERLARRGLRYRLYETTTDLAVRSFLCLLADETRDPPMVCAGGAAGLDPVRAAGKAMCEAVQTREWAKFLGGPPAAGYGPDFAGVRSFEDHVTLYAYTDMREALAFLVDRAGPPPGRADWRSGAHGDPREDLRTVVAALAAAGCEALALDLTTVDVRDAGFAVIKALVPQLQPLDASHTHRFLGGTRLYEVPARLGYGPVPATTDAVNPFPHPYP